MINIKKTVARTNESEFITTETLRAGELCHLGELEGEGEGEFGWGEWG